MLKKVAVPDLAYLTSLTPSHVANPPQSLTQGTLVAQGPTPPTNGHDQDMSDTTGAQEGVYSSMHAPMPVTPMMLATLSEDDSPSGPVVPFPNPALNTSTPNDLIEALSAVAETTLEMVTFSSLAHCQDQFFPIGT